MRIENYTIDSFDEIIVNRYRDGAWLTTIEEPKGFKVSNTSETKDVTGKGDRIIKTLDKNKACEITGQSGLLSGGLLTAQLGTDPVDNDAKVLNVEIVTITADMLTNGYTTAFAAVGTAGAEIGNIQILTNNRACEKELKQGSAAGKDVFAYDPTTKKITFPTSGLEAGNVIRIAYDYKPESSVTYSNMAEVYSERVKIIANMTVNDPCTDEKLHGQLIVYRAKMSGSFDLDFIADQMVHDFSAKSEYSLCAGSDKKYWDFVVFN